MIAILEFGELFGIKNGIMKIDGDPEFINVPIANKFSVKWDSGPEHVCADFTETQYATYYKFCGLNSKSTMYRFMFGEKEV